MSPMPGRWDVNGSCAGANEPITEDHVSVLPAALAPARRVSAARGRAAVRAGSGPAPRRGRAPAPAPRPAGAASHLAAADRRPRGAPRADQASVAPCAPVAGAGAGPGPGGVGNPPGVAPPHAVAGATPSRRGAVLRARGAAAVLAA